MDERKKFTLINWIICIVEIIIFVILDVVLKLPFYVTWIAFVPDFIFVLVFKKKNKL